MQNDRHTRSGQSVVESILLLPFFLVLVFGLLQLGQLATALLVSNYAASSMARQMVKNNAASSDNSRFNTLLTAGMKHARIEPEMLPDTTTGGMLANIKVHACADIDALPFVRQFFGKALASTLGNASNCQSISTFAYTANPGRFTVHGKATARMNYQPKG